MRVLSLCDYTGIMVEPWLAAGFEATIVDTQHPEGVTVDGPLQRVGADVTTWLPPMDDYAIVFAFPPCTHLANSGARWFKDKGLPALISGLQVVEACRRICEWSGAPWMLENPVGTLSTYWRKPDFMFDPCDFGDPYTKRTCLWVGGGLVLPPKNRVEPTEGSKMHLVSPSPERGNIRSTTPPGFAAAMFSANHFRNAA